MKLISCYIENFGGLSRYTVNFEPGVTVIDRANGFGKTTLAEFIVAMFYGFPRRGGSIRKDRRKKYLPWQSGSFGGNLIFEKEGKKYRIERTFSEKPNGDKCKITDPDTGEVCTEFTEDIGPELFGLDRDSFARSTYLPQLHEEGNITTGNMQAKLGNLVEDTNDINNFEKAVAALKKERSRYEAYKGTGGSVRDAIRHISGLQSDIAGKESRRKELEEKKDTVLSLEKESTGLERNLETVRKEITASSEMAVREALTAQYAEKKTAFETGEKSLEELRNKYPGGVPSMEEVEELESVYDTVAGLRNRADQTASGQEDRKTVESGTIRFREGVPAAEDFADYRRQCREYIEVSGRCESAGLQEDEKNRFSDLQRFFEPGPVDEDFFAACQENINRLQSVKTKLEMQNMSEGDTARLNHLKAFFAAGVPEEEEIAVNRENVKTVSLLKEDNVRLTAAGRGASAQAEPVSKKGNAVSLICGILGVLLLVSGIVFMAVGSYGVGGISLGVGLLVVVTALFLYLRRTISVRISPADSGTGGLSSADRETVRENERKIAMLEQSTLSFVARFISDGRTLSEKMQEICAKKSAYLELTGAQEGYREEREKLTGEYNALEKTLADAFYPYFGEITDFGEALSVIRTRAELFRALKEKETSSVAEREQLQQEKETLGESISAFLKPYCGEADPDRFSEMLTKLEQDCSTWQEAKKRVEEADSREAGRKEMLTECRDKVERFNERYQLHLDPDRKETYRALYDEVKEERALSASLEQQEKEMNAFYTEHREILESGLQHPEKTPEELKLEEKELTEKTAAVKKRILELNQEISPLQEMLDSIPEQRDQLERWTEKKDEDQKNKELLEKTVEFMEQARNSLTGSYVGPIRESLKKYLQEAAGTGENKVVVTPGLDVQVERQGVFRELDYFSAGENDLVLFCMRLALVDALFQDARPFLILDDPFVNLDDENTERALQLLKKLEQDYQIIYLVCNSSRNFV